MPVSQVGTTQGSKHVHDAKDTVGGMRPVCRASDVRAALRVAVRLDTSDVTCPRCLKARGASE